MGNHHCGEWEGLSSALIGGHGRGEAAVSGPGAGRPLLSGVYIWLSLVGLKLGMETNVEALL